MAGGWKIWRVIITVWDREDGVKKFRFLKRGGHKSFEFIIGSQNRRGNSD